MHINGQVIADRRRRLLLTQPELAEKVGIARESLSRIETGRNQPHPRTTRALLDALNLTIDDVIREEAKAS